MRLFTVVEYCFDEIISGNMWVLGENGLIEPDQTLHLHYQEVDRVLAGKLSNDNRSMVQVGNRGPVSCLPILTM